MSNNSSSQHPPWKPLQLPRYGEIMRARCDALANDIVNDKDRRELVLRDHCAVHRSLFEGLTPDGYEAYAGTYRGTVGTPLQGRESGGPSLLLPGREFSFMPSALVAKQMQNLLDVVADAVDNPPHGPDEKLGKLAYIFGLFGCIHPFLDGNGHVQHALFAAMATSFSIPLSPRFSIHPRPYDILLMTMLELFTRNQASQDDINRVAEYLKFFLDGEYALPYADFDA